MTHIFKVLKLFTIAFLLAGSVVAQGTSKNVLFLGNSYTYGNNLPNMVSQLATSAGDALTFDANTPGGHRLFQHAANPTSLQKIAVGTWDYVIIQAQSQEPSWGTPQVENEVLPYAKILSDTARAANECANPMFFMTWGRENGDQQNCPIYSWLCTYEGMDSALAANYTRMAQENKGVVSPVGKVWRRVREDLGLQLYTGDGSHPNLTGSYVAACAFYTSIFQKDPTLCTWDGGLDPNVAMQIRNISKTVVYDNLSNFSFVENHSIANFSSQVNHDTVSLDVTGSVYDSLRWNLGDGNQSTSENYTHIYGDSGMYTIELITFKCGLSDTTTQTVQTSLAPDPDPVDPGDTLSVSSYSLDNSFTVFPIPVTSDLNINAGFDIESITIFDLHGRVIFQSEDSKPITNLPVHHWKSGIYFLIVSDELGNIGRKRIVKE